MPKKFSLADRRRWLADYESGKPIASIAKEAHADVRTVKRAIEEARLARDASAARAELLKEALRKHQDTLLELIHGILSSLEPPPLDRLVPWRSGEFWASISLPGAHAEFQGDIFGPAVNVRLEVEGRVEWELLVEHLKRDKLWKMLEDWKKAVAAHLQAKVRLFKKAASLLAEKSGYPLVEEPGTPPFLYGDNSVRLLSRSALSEGLGLLPMGSFEGELAADPESGEVRWQGFIVARAPKAEVEAKLAILGALAELKGSEELKEAVRTYQLAQEAATKAKRIAEELALLGMVPGQCRVCSRLGV